MREVAEVDLRTGCLRWRGQMPSVPAFGWPIVLLDVTDLAPGLKNASGLLTPSGNPADANCPRYDALTGALRLTKNGNAAATVPVAVADHGLAL